LTTLALTNGPLSFEADVIVLHSPLSTSCFPLSDLSWILFYSNFDQ
jgi:hypothetical protein